MSEALRGVVYNIVERGAWKPIIEELKRCILRRAISLRPHLVNHDEIEGTFRDGFNAAVKSYKENLEKGLWERS